MQVRMEKISVVWPRHSLPTNKQFFGSTSVSFVAVATRKLESMDYCLIVLLPTQKILGESVSHPRRRLP
jgi:hypothetical protein